MQDAQETDLPAYIRQMTLLAYLEPGQFGETRAPFPLEQAQIGIIHRGQYYLLPVCDKNGKPLDVLTVRAQVTMLIKSSPTEMNPTPARLDSLARVQRAALPELRLKLDPKLVAELDRLRYAPILLNMDQRPRDVPLAEIRRAERGIGDHPLTIFDTGETFVFDQSHIFFDGAWGSALAEIMTNEALSWANYLRLLASPAAQGERLWSRLHLQPSAADMDLIQQAPHVIYEADAETKKVNIKACQNLRKIFKLRNDLLSLTVNDLLVLYRAIHATTYQPSDSVRAELDRLAVTHPDVAAAIRTAIEESRKVNPAILIPVDASQRVPRDRVYPLNVEVPLHELDLLDLHARAIQALDSYDTGKSGLRRQVYIEFDKVQRMYLASLAGFGAYLKRAREVAIQGQSASVGAIKLLAHLHPVLQRLLDKVPEKFQLLNNLIKGREVLSNVGQVAPTSTLTRFLTAKDDNEQKRLAWGVMTDANNTMVVSLRDFRPHVATLHSIGRSDLANLLAQDYLDSYANGFNAFIRDLYRITERSRETKSTIGRLIKIS